MSPRRIVTSEVNQSSPWEAASPFTLAPGADFHDSRSMPRSLTPQADDALTDALNHAREFVQIVMERAPAIYEQLLETPAVRQRISTRTTFNDGKVLAWAQFLVFRQEFLRRFPDASRAACINAFSGLFLKNDISMTNLADVMENSVTDELQRLAAPGDEQSPD